MITSSFDNFYTLLNKCIFFSDFLNSKLNLNRIEIFIQIEQFRFFRHLNVKLC
jgi:hypothetical protein